MVVNKTGHIFVASKTQTSELEMLKIVVFSVAISSSYVHRLHLLWRMSPFVNKSWICAIVVR